jgi:hypothetical protein
LKKMTQETISSSMTIYPGLITEFASVAIVGAGVTVVAPDGVGYDTTGDVYTVKDGATFEIAFPEGTNTGDSFRIGNSGTLEVETGFSTNIGTGITFTGTRGVLVVDAGSQLSDFSGVYGFKYGDTIDFLGDGTPIGSVTTDYSALLNETAFSVETTKGEETFALHGYYDNQAFTAAADGHGGFTLVDDTQCFSAGTRILTIAGEVPVEELMLGDMVLLHDGAAAPIIFIGRRNLSAVAHSKPETVRPVRIPVGALGEGVPGRDLLVSPDHALFLDGVLVPAKDLIDGVMIRQEKSINRLSYYHVELPRHGILLAEGAAAESFLNVGHRGMFDNADEPVVLQTALMHRERELRSVAPLVTGGPALAAIRAALHTRALRQGYRVMEAPGIALSVNDELLLPTACTRSEAIFELPDDAAGVVLLSEVFTPAEIDPSSGDRRVLGIAVTGLALDGAEVAPEAVIYPEDLHRRDADERASWTRGPARLLLPAGTHMVTVRIAGWPRKWQAAARVAA